MTDTVGAVIDGPDIFVVGASRSGTTWVQAVLACHPDVVTTNETRVIDALERVGRFHGPADETGLHHVVDDDEFDEWRRDLWQRCRRALLSARPDASRVLEKTPSHGRNIDLIRRISPGSRIVVVVRDPRSVVRSLVERRRVAGRTWAPHTVKEATDMWLQHVRAQLAACGDDTIVVRHEDLTADPSRFDTIVEFVGLDLDRWTRPDTQLTPANLPTVNAVTRRDGQWTPYTLGARAGHSFDDRTDTWTMSSRDTAYVEWACAREMARLGYAGGRSRRPAVAWTTTMASAAVDRLRTEVTGVRRRVTTP